MTLRACCTAACKTVVPTCRYQVNGTILQLGTDPLPCIADRTWTFIAAAAPTEDDQVACNVTGPAADSLALVFSDEFKDCNPEVTTVNVSVVAADAVCSSMLSLGNYTGTRL
jgi:hypothetical protein